MDFYVKVVALVPYIFFGLVGISIAVRNAYETLPEYRKATLGAYLATAGLLIGRIRI